MVNARWIGVVGIGWHELQRIPGHGHLALPDPKRPAVVDHRSDWFARVVEQDIPQAASIVAVQVSDMLAEHTVQATQFRRRNGRGRVLRKG